MTLSRIRLTRFTAFEDLGFVPSPGVNVLIGANGTGQTHLMKVAYAACDISKSQQAYADKLVRVFLPPKRALGRLVKRRSEGSRAKIEVIRGDLKLGVTFSNHVKDWNHAKVVTTGAAAWYEEQLETVYVPVKEMRRRYS